MNGLTVKQAAQYATVSEGLIRQWVRDGTLPHFRLGGQGKRGHIRIAVEDLDGVLANFRVGQKRPEPVKAPVQKPATPPSVLRHIRLA